MTRRRPPLIQYAGRDSGRLGAALWLAAAVVGMLLAFWAGRCL